jgi:hypothetical protein
VELLYRTKGRWRMWNWIIKSQWVSVFLLAGCISILGCSTPRQDLQKDVLADTSDPFSDPFFTKPPDWDNSVLQQSEVLAKEDEEEKKPQSFLKRTEGIVFGTLVVGGTLAQLAVPFLGL